MASWRTPYRSALRDLAQALVDQAQVKRQNEELQSQYQMQADMIQAQSFENMMTTAAQTTQNVFNDIQQQRLRDEQTMLTQNQDALRRAEADLAKAQTTLSQLEALGGDPAKIEQQRTLVNRLSGVVNAPIANVGQMYANLMSGVLVPGTTTGPQLTPFAAGYQGPARQGGMEAPQGVIPGVTTPGMTGMDVLTGGMGAAASLQRVAGVQNVMTESIINRITNVNPSDPVSVYQAYAAVQQLEGLPLEIRSTLEADANSVLQYYENSPEAQAMTDRANRMAEAGVTTAEAQAARSVAEANYFIETRPYEWARLQRALGNEQATAVVNAYNTGILTGLNDEDKVELARTVGTTVEGLDEWSAGRIADNETRNDLDMRLNELNVQAREQQITLGDQQVALNDIALERSVWEFEREKFFAPMQDELTIATGVASAINANDADMLAHYMAAFDNPSSPLGQQLRATYGDSYGDYLAAQYAGALERKTYERNILKYDEQARAAQVELAELNLRSGRALTDLQIAAMAARYQADEARALMDIRALPLAEMTGTLTTLGSLAAALPPTWWDSVPKDVADRLSALGLSTDVFREMSVAAEWVRAAPEREQAWTLINTMLKTVPTDDASQAVMRDGLMRAVNTLGIEPESEMALVAALEGMWTLNNAQLAKTMADLALNSATATTPEDASRAITAWASVEEGLLAEYQSVKPQEIMNNECADVLNLQITEGVYGLQVNSGTWRTTPEAHRAKDPSLTTEQATQMANTCRVIQTEYFDLANNISYANRQRGFWSNYINERLGGEVTPSFNPTNIPGETGQPAPAPAATPAPVPAPASQATPPPVPPPAATNFVDPIRNRVSVGFDVNGTPLNGPDVARFNELANMFAYSNYRADDPDFDRARAIAELEDELTKKYGANAVDTVMNYIFGKTPAGQ